MIIELILAAVLSQPVVYDGDTFKIDKTKYRLAHIDALELKQPGGIEAKNHLNKLLSKPSWLSIDIVGKDVYHRNLVVVKKGRTEVNYRMCQDGWAFSYLNKKNKYLQAQQAAAGLNKGMFKLSQPEYPWVYRKRIKK